MSYILDALKRAEQQRGGPARASVRAPRDTPFEAASRGPWPWVAAGVVGVGAIVAVVTLWPATTPAPAPTPAPVAAIGAGSGPAESAARRPGTAQPAAVAPGPPASPSPTRVPPSASRAVESRTPAPAEQGAGSRRPHRPERGARTGAASMPDSSPVIPEPEPGQVTGSDEAAPAMRPTVRIQESSPGPPAPRTDRRAVTVAPGGPAGGELKALAARISLQVLSWAPDPKDRFVFLNGRRYAEGQVVDDKLLVERITESGVVLSYRGERVTLTGR